VRLWPRLWEGASSFQRERPARSALRDDRDLRTNPVVVLSGARPYCFPLADLVQVAASAILALHPARDNASVHVAVGDVVGSQRERLARVATLALPRPRRGFDQHSRASATALNHRHAGESTTARPWRRQVTQAASAFQFRTSPRRDHRPARVQAGRSARAGSSRRSGADSRSVVVGCGLRDPQLEPRAEQHRAFCVGELHGRER
jgi:hypothetical protein